MSVLDPDVATFLDDVTEPLPSLCDLPKGLTRLPNLSDWWPGDLLLFKANSPLGQAIALVQRRYASPKDASWSHAAVYVGEGLYADAQFGARVSIRKDLLTVCNKRPVRVRRGHADTGYTRKTGERIVKHVREAIGGKYGYERILEIADKTVDDMTGKRFVTFRQAKSLRQPLICSELYIRAFDEATGIPLRVTEDAPPLPVLLAMPADPSSASVLQDVRIGWRRPAAR